MIRVQFLGPPKEFRRVAERVELIRMTVYLSLNLFWKLEIYLWPLNWCKINWSTKISSRIFNHFLFWNFCNAFRLRSYFCYLTIILNWNQQNNTTFLLNIRPHFSGEYQVFNRAVKIIVDYILKFIVFSVKKLTSINIYLQNHQRKCFWSPVH